MASQTRSQKTTSVRKEYVRSPFRSPTSPLSPTKISRHQEKEELMQLNNRLAVYIDKIRTLEVENSGLYTRVTTIVEEHTQEVTNIKALYEAELGDARKLLDETAKEKARLELDVGRLQHDLDDYKHRFSKLEKDYVAVQKKIHNLEGALAEKDFRLKSLSSENRQLESDNNDLKKSLQKKEKQLLTAKKQVEEETVLRVDLENRMQSLKEELVFKESIYKEELIKTTTHRQEDITEIDNRNRQEYESRLAESLADIREEHEDHIESLRSDTEHIYDSKYEDLKRIAEQQRKLASAAQNELRETRSSLDSLDKAVSTLKSENDILSLRIKCLEKQNKEDRDDYQNALNDHDEEMSALRDQIEEQLKEYENLLATKVSLDAEIAAYNNLLEAEEARLNISPSPPRSQTRAKKRSSQKVQTPIRQVRAKRRRVRDTYSLVQNENTSGAVSIVEVSPEGTFIKLKNNSETDQAMGGWLLKNSAGDEEVTYKFSSKYTLKAEQEVAVWSSDSGKVHNPPSELLAKNRPSWGSGEEVSTSLLDSNGEVTATWTLKREYSFSEQPSEVSKGCLLM